MSDIEQISQHHLQQLFDEGQALKATILSFLGAALPGPDPGRGGAGPPDTAQAGEGAERELQIKVKRWFNTLKIDILGKTLEPSDHLYSWLIQVESGLRRKREVVYPGSRKTLVTLSVGEAKREAAEGMDAALAFLSSVPNFERRTRVGQPTAFIMMWMSQKNHDLEDIANAIKEVCGDFRISAVRADDIDHDDKITDMVQRYIRESDLLIADLTGARPSVYYEVGFAHALKKLPILFCKEGAETHFDLRVYNVRRYKNISHLKKLLSEVLEKRVRDQSRAAATQ